MPERALKCRGGLAVPHLGHDVRQNPRMPERALKPESQLEDRREGRQSESPNARKGIEIERPGARAQGRGSESESPNARKGIEILQPRPVVHTESSVRIPECPKGH